MPFKPACALNMYRSFRALDNRGVSTGNSLEEACRRHGIKAGGHSAVGDCQATLALLGVLAQVEVAHVKAPVEPDVVEVNAIPGDSRRVEVWDTRSDSALADVSDEVGMAPEALRAVEEALSVITSTRSQNQGRAVRRARMHDPSFMQALYRESALNQASQLLEDSLYFLQHPESSGSGECRAPQRGRCFMCSEPVCTTHGCKKCTGKTWADGWVCYECGAEAYRMGMLAVE
jgi:hypothetical protein